MMKNKLYIAFAAISLIFLNGCFEDPGTEVLFDAQFVELDAGSGSGGGRAFSYLRVNDGNFVDAGFGVTYSGAASSSDISITYEVDASSTAIENLHYRVTGNSVTIPAGSFSTALPFEVFPDAMNPGEQFTIVVNITSSDVTIHPDYGSATHTIQITCPSDLGGTYTVAGVGWCGTAFTGAEVVWTDLGGGVYEVDDFSFGAYDACYGAGATLPGGNLRLNDVCGRIFPTGTSRWGEVYTFSNGSVNGADFTLSWVNDYAEGGDVVITRTDGTDWPPLTTD
jgi:hypothetical protein